MLKTTLPKSYGFSAFYIKVQPHLWFRVYKVEHIFSTVGEAHIFVFHISFRHLHRLKHFKWAFKNTIAFECNVDNGIAIWNDLKSFGKSDISHIFKG